MVPRKYLVILGLLLSGVAVTVQAAPQIVVGQFQENNNIVLQMAVTPRAIAAGETAVLTLYATNPTAEQTAPLIKITIPAGIELDINDLPPGTAFDFHGSSLTWLPILPSHGGASRLDISMIALVADLKSPQKALDISVESMGFRQSYSADLWVGTLPGAQILFEPPAVAAGQPVKLRAKSSGPGPFYQVWVLGDGRVIEAQDPEVIFPTPGHHLVTLQISNPLGTTLASGAVEVVAQPIAEFTPASHSAEPGQSLAFANLSGGERPMRYLWDFGDGTTSAEINPVHTYLNPGTFVVRLIASNNLGTSEASATVNIGSSPLLEVAVDEVGAAGRSISGHAEVGAGVTTVMWDMGDGTLYAGNDIAHIYASPGTYNVTVKAANSLSESRVSRVIVIESHFLFEYLPLILSGIDEALGTGFLLDNLSAPAPTQDETAALESLQLVEHLTPAEKLLAYINEARRINNLGALSYEATLSVAAQAHTDDMASAGFTGHVGSDRSSPPYRIRLHGYSGGYGGEATAWGMDNPIEPVIYWLESPAHRDIILHPGVTEVGLGHTVDYESPNVWYWTAEFASPDLPVVAAPAPEPLPAVEPVAASPQLVALGPPRDSNFAIDNGVNLLFTWSWPTPLSADEWFVVYLDDGFRSFRAGTVTRPGEADQYQLRLLVSDLPVAKGAYTWYVQLEDTSTHETIATTEPWPIGFAGAISGTD